MLEINGLGKTYGTGADRDARRRRRHVRRRARASSSASSARRAAGRRRCSSASPACSGRRAGEVLLRGTRVTAPPDQMALVFQEYSRSLMPWMSVRNNVLLPLRHKQLSKARARRARRGVARRRRARPLHRPLPVAALRRDAAARRDRAGARLPAVDPADGRAVRLGRRADARRPRGPRARGARGVRDHDPLRHPRHRRVGVSLRPRRRAHALADRGEGDDPGRPAEAARPDRDEGAAGVRAAPRRTSTG